MSVPQELVKFMREHDCSPGHCKKELYEGIDCHPGDCEYNCTKHPQEGAPVKEDKEPVKKEPAPMYYPPRAPIRKRRK